MGAYLSQPVTDKETFTGQGVDVKYGGAAMQGWRKTMEDAHIAVTGLAGNPEISMFSVFDGHGGGEVAKFCQKHMASEIQQLKEFQGGSIEDALRTVFHRMDDLLRDSKFSEEIEQLKGKEGSDEDDDADAPLDPLDLIKRVFKIKNYPPEEQSSAPGNPVLQITEEPPEVKIQAGCTSVVALKCGSELYVANAGDSRGVLCRGGGQALALSEDHKPAQEGERRRIINAGGFLSEIGGVCRVNGNLNLSRAIGDLKYKTNPDLPAKDQIITAEPDIARVTLQPDDRFLLLACDGVWDVMTNQQAVDFVSQRLDQGKSIPEACSLLLDACLADDPKEAKGVGCDNMTIVIVLLHQQAQAGAAAAQQAESAAKA
jgi:protein phosphatase 1G